MASSLALTACTSFRKGRETISGEMLGGKCVFESLNESSSLVRAGLGAGSLEVAEAKGAPCSGSATTYERLAGAEFLDIDTERQAGGLADLVERDERRLELIEGNSKLQT